MRHYFISFLTIVLFAAFAIAVSAQNADVGITAKFAGGEVASVDSGKIVLNTKDGAIDVVLSGATEYKRIPPENPSLKAAVDAAFGDIAAGDKLLVTGDVSADKKQIPAKKIFIISKADIEKKLSKEAQEWRARGINGRVTAVNLETGEVTISVRGLAGETSVVVSPKDNAEVFRYAENSNKFTDAKKASIKEIYVGDMLRALGDRTADGANFKAEKIIAGAFQTVIGKVKSVDAARNEIVVEDQKTKQDVTIAVGQDSQLKKFPEEMAKRLAMMQAMRASGMTPPQGTNPPADAGQGQGQGANGTRGDVNEMFERLPVITVAELKAGDMIAVSSSKNADPSRITAIRLAAGIEPFMQTPQIPGGGRNRPGGQSSDFNIPGLDGGFDVP